MSRQRTTLPALARSLVVMLAVLALHLRSLLAHTSVDVWFWLRLALAAFLVVAAVAPLAFPGRARTSTRRD